MDTEQTSRLSGSDADIAECLRAVIENPRIAALRVALGTRLFVAGKFRGALANYAKAHELDPAYENLDRYLAWAQEASRGEAKDEVAQRQKAFERQRTANVDSARKAILERGAEADCFALWQRAVSADPSLLRKLDEWITQALESEDLPLAARCARINAGLRFGSRWYPGFRAAESAVPHFRTSPLTLTIPKLQHDLEQFAYLQRRGCVDTTLLEGLDEYPRAIERLRALGADPSESMTDVEQERMGGIYNRIVHLYDAPRVKRALSASWDAAEVRRRYRENAPGIAVVDDFLSREALAGLREFCHASTVWSANVYAQGRLGSFFRAGFNCELLIQIAQELREALSELLTDACPLRQLWGFKYPPTLDADTIHADFAALNVNFWITPESANDDPRCGGMIVHDCEAPPDWDFDLYNRRTDLIREFLATQKAKRLEIAYRENRAVIFNSNLFHETAPLRFRTGYENRRVNITLLYGDRAGATPG